MPSKMQPLLVAALSVAWLAAAPVAHAQSNSQVPSKVQPQPASPGVSDQKLDAAAKAIEHVADLKQKYQERLSTASPTEKQKLAGEANNAITKAVTDQGLSLEEYTSILEVAQNDPSVRNRLLQRLHPSKQ